MQPIPILVWPAGAEALPSHAKARGALKRLRVMAIAYPVVLIPVAVFLLDMDTPYLVAMSAFALFGGAFFYRFAARQGEMDDAQMSGEVPIVAAEPVDGGHHLVVSVALGKDRRLALDAGAAVAVTVARARDPRNASRKLGWVDWTFALKGSPPVAARTWFDPDAAALKAVERALRGIGVTAVISHTPYEDA